MLKDVSIDDYRNCKAGFRDKYIYEFVQKINNKEFDLDKIDNMDSNEALDYLMTNKGIGEKVASCILLFGYHRFDVFPIDTWVKKFMKEKYNLTTVPSIREYMYNKYNKYSGLIIQYVFDYSRNRK
jgi:N-glycosylase/DNA lyase